MSIITPIAETADTVTLARSDFEAMLDALEDAADVATLKAASAEEARVGKEAYRANALPAELVERMILGGETPLKVWREHRKLTVAALAAAAGVSGSYISEIETGRKPGSVTALAKLATALNLSIDDLVA
jgi:DNA-binding XRE family transcriptional regulator